MSVSFAFFPCKCAHCTPNILLTHAYCAAHSHLMCTSYLFAVSNLLLLRFFSLCIDSNSICLLQLICSFDFFLFVSLSSALLTCHTQLLMALFWQFKNRLENGRGVREHLMTCFAIFVSYYPHKVIL